MEKVLKVLLLLSIIAAVLVSLSQRLLPSKEIGEEEYLRIVMPEADSFSEKKETPPHYEAYKEKKGREKELIGLCFLTTDLFPDERGYAGPVYILVGMDLKGFITGIKVIAHSETPAYVYRIEEPWFARQFKGKSVFDEFKLGKDVDGITGATVTVSAIARAVKKSIRKMARELLRMEIPGEGEVSVLAQLKGPHIYFLLGLFLLAVFGYCRRIIWLRYLTLFVSFIYLGFIKGSFISVINIVSLISLKFPLLQTNLFWYVLLGLTVISTLLFVRLYCGWICPFGSVQTALDKFVPVKAEVSRKVHRRARLIKYFLLIGLIIAVLFRQNLSLVNFEPFITLFSRKGDLLRWSFLILVLGASAFLPRFWCRYLCPVGAVLSLLGGKGKFRIKSGDRYYTHCPMNALEAGKRIDSGECIGCNQCRRKG